MRKRAAHNLLEMIIAVSIFLTVATALAMVWIQHSRAIQASGMRLTAQHVCEQAMEECIAAGYVNVDNLVAAPTVINVTDILRGVPSTSTFKVHVTVTPDSVPPPNTSKVVHSIVEWDDTTGHSQIDFKTVISYHV